MWRPRAKLGKKFREDNVKRTSLSFVFGAAVWVSSVGFAAPVSAAILDFSSPEYLGLVNDGAPAGATNEASYINILVDQPLGSGPTLVGTEFYTRSNNVLCSD